MGQNLQHNITYSEKERCECIAFDNVSKNDKRLKQIDLGGIYLGDVTHVLTKVNDFQLNLDFLKYITELEYLRDADEIGPKEFEKQILYLQQENLFIKGLRMIPSREASYTKVIIQALGRMNRTFNKIKQPLVLAHNSVVKSISYLGLNHNLFSPEFKALMNEKDGFVKNIQIDQINIKKENYTSYTLRDNNQLVSGLKSNNERLIEEYKRIRRNLLYFPTISSDDLKRLQSNSNRCLQYLENPEETDNYFVKIESLEKGIFEFDPDINDGGIFEVSSANSGLDDILKYEGMTDFFNQNGYATYWKKNKYIMNPIQNINLYSGVLGEVAGKFILEKVLKTKLLNFEDIRNIELFDFKIWNKNIAIDFKNWNLGHMENREKALKKVVYKLNKLSKNTGNPWKVIIINIFKNINSKITVTANNRIMEIPALINHNGQLVLNSDMKKLIGEFLNEK